ncbi:hypothetical protein BAE44_0008893, partial [Dichanthelium oligosanthes]
LTRSYLENYHGSEVNDLLYG